MWFSISSRNAALFSFLQHSSRVHACCIEYPVANGKQACQQQHQQSGNERSRAYLWVIGIYKPENNFIHDQVTHYGTQSKAGKQQENKILCNQPYDARN